MKEINNLPCICERFETTDEYIARGGKITICPPAHPSIIDINELKAKILLKKLEKKNANNNK